MTRWKFAAIFGLCLSFFAGAAQAKGLTKNTSNFLSTQYAKRIGWLRTVTGALRQQVKAVKALDLSSYRNGSYRKYRKRARLALLKGIIYKRLSNIRSLKGSLGKALKGAKAVNQSYLAALSNKYNILERSLQSILKGATAKGMNPVAIPLSILPRGFGDKVQVK